MSRVTKRARLVINDATGEALPSKARIIVNDPNAVVPPIDPTFVIMSVTQINVFRSGAGSIQPLTTTTTINGRTVMVLATLGLKATPTITSGVSATWNYYETSTVAWGFRCQQAGYFDIHIDMPVALDPNVDINHELNCNLNGVAKEDGSDTRFGVWRIEPTSATTHSWNPTLNISGTFALNDEITFYWRSDGVKTVTGRSIGFKAFEIA